MSSPSKSAARAETAKPAGALTRALRLAEAERRGGRKGKRPERQQKVERDWIAGEGIRHTARVLAEAVNRRDGAISELEPAQVLDLVAGRLVSPCLGPDVPATYAVSNVSLPPGKTMRTAFGEMVQLSPEGEVRRVSGEVEICRALQEAGILEEDDFKGRFDEAINAALTRWSHGLFDGRAPVIFDALTIMWSDDADHFEGEGVESEPWVAEFEGIEGRQVGFLGLMWDQHHANAAVIGDQVSRLEDLHAGLGKGLLHTVECAIVQVGGLGFNIADEHISMWELEWEADEANNDLTLLTLDRFYEAIPRWVARTGQIDRDMFGHALAELSRQVEHDYTEEAEEFAWVLERTLALSAALEALYNSRHRRYGCHLGIFSEEYGTNPHASVYLKWEPEDAMDRFVDDYYQGMMENGEMSDFVWLAGWQTGIDGAEGRVGRTKTGGTLADAIENLGLVLRILGLADQLLAWMDTSETQRDPLFVDQVTARALQLPEWATPTAADVVEGV